MHSFEAPRNHSFSLHLVVLISVLWIPWPYPALNHLIETQQASSLLRWKRQLYAKHSYSSRWIEFVAWSASQPHVQARNIWFHIGDWQNFFLDSIDSIVTTLYALTAAELCQNTGTVTSGHHSKHFISWKQLHWELCLEKHHPGSSVV